MLVYDGDDCYEVDDADCELEADGFWLCFDEDYVDEFFEYCDDDSDE
jgi:hypothetical protein